LKKLAVIIPTYNRPELLKEAIQATLDQSYPPQEIIAVDNASRVPVARALGDWLRDKEKVTILRLEPNVYPAGAFHEGLKYAFQKGFDGYMFFDDDAEPAEECIGRLMAHFHDDIGFVAPLVYDSIAEQYQFFQNKKMSKGLLYDIPIFTDPEEIQPGLIQVDANATTGIVVSHRAVESAGNINRHLRTYGEDTDFSLRIARHSGGYLVPDALLIHKVQPADMSTQPLKNYYWVRNRHYIIKHHAGRRYVAKYALATTLEELKQILLLRRLKTSFYRLFAIGEGLLGTVPTETVHQGLLEKTPGVQVTVSKAPRGEPGQ